MTQIEQIKAEIERLKVEIPYHENAWSVLNKLKTFINSLPAEQPSEDLKKEIDRFQKAKYGGDVISVASIACHFAIWQKQQMLKSAVDATCVLLPPPDLFKVLICHDVTDKLSKGEKVKIITVTVKENEL